MRHGLTTRDFWNPAREMTPLFQDFDDMLDRLLMPMTVMRRDRQVFSPAVDIEETDSHYLVSFDLPGISKDDVKVEVVDNQLTVSGERKVEKRDKKSNRVSERYYGNFTRTIALPTSVDASKVEASFRDGVLQIAIPKSEAARPRQIKVSEGEKGGIFSKLLGHKETEREAKDSGHKAS